MGEGVLPFDFINTLSPFYIVLDKSGDINYISPFFKKILINEDLSCIKLTRPFSTNIYRSILEELTGMVLFFSIEGETVRQMKGQSIIYNDLVILIGTPLINSASELERFGMKMTDLPIHDSTGDLLLAVEANRISLLDAKESMTKLEKALEETRKLGESLATAVEIKTIKYKLEKETAEKALSELKESRIALSRAERDASLTQIATHLAHEINNPLNYILTGNIVLSDSIESLISTIKEAIPPGPESEDFFEYIQKYINSIYSSLDSIKQGSIRIQENIKELRGITQIDGDIYTRLDIFSEVQKTFLSLLQKNKWNKDDWKVNINSKDLYGYFHTNEQSFDFFGNPFILAFALRIIFDYSMKKGFKNQVNELNILVDRVINNTKKFISIGVSHKSRVLTSDEKKDIFSLHINKTGFGELINLGMMRELIRKSGGFLTLAEDGSKGNVEIVLLLSYN